jgi:hypothetical protein
MTFSINRKDREGGISRKEKDHHHKKEGRKNAGPDIDYKAGQSRNIRKREERILVSVHIRETLRICTYIVRTKKRRIVLTRRRANIAHKRRRILRRGRRRILRTRGGYCAPGGRGEYSVQEEDITHQKEEENIAYKEKNNAYKERAHKEKENIA